MRDQYDPPRQCSELTVFRTGRWSTFQIFPHRVINAPRAHFSFPVMRYERIEVSIRIFHTKVSMHLGAFQCTTFNVPRYQWRISGIPHSDMNARRTHVIFFFFSHVATRGAIFISTCQSEQASMAHRHCNAQAISQCYKTTRWWTLDRRRPKHRRLYQACFDISRTCHSWPCAIEWTGCLPWLPT